LVLTGYGEQHKNCGAHATVANAGQAAKLILEMSDP